MIYTTKYRPGLSDINQDYTVKKSAILKILEDSAGFHTDAVGVDGIDKINETRRAWAILDWQVEILEPIRYGDDLTIKTWSRKFKRTCAYRDFEIFKDDKVCVKASSRWFIIDIDKRLPVRITEEISNPYESEDRAVFSDEDMTEHPTPLENYEEVFSYKTRRSDQDIIGHVHNINYLNYFDDCLDFDEIGKIKNIRLYFKKEIQGGAVVNIKKHKAEDGTYYFAIESEDGSEIHSICIMS